MSIISDIPVKAADPMVESSVNLLNQTNELYNLLEQALPDGQLKQDILKYTAQKRQEYIKGIVLK